VSEEIRGRLLLGDEIIPGRLLIDGETIADVTRDEQETGPIIAPGYVDLQVNGGYGVDVAEGPEAIRTISRRLPETGVVAYLPTVITSEPDVYPSVAAAFTEAAGCAGARPLGLHLEGPFLSPRRAGAHRPDLMESADLSVLGRILDAGQVRLMTVAPDRPDALDVIRLVRSHGIAVSLGHTDATYEQFEAGADAGAMMATHLFNAMSAFGHRAPGAIGATLLDDRVTAGVIADGIHSHPASLRLAFRAKGPDRLLLVTDMVAAAGMPPGEYELGGRRVIADGRAVRLPDGTLAGAALTMDDAVRAMVRWTEATVPQALRMAAEIPGRILDVPARRIAVGAPADLVVLDEGLKVKGTMIGGMWVYQRPE